MPCNFNRYISIIKFLLTLLVSLTLTTTIHGQVMSYSDLETVIPFLQQEKFKIAFKKTDILLNSTQDDSSDLRGIITYVNIYSAAGMVTIDQMTYDDLTKNVSKYLGHWIVMSAHSCIDTSKHAFNSLSFAMQDGVIQGSTVTSDLAEIHILCFEYFKYAQPIAPVEFIGKKVRCGGILESFEVNSNFSKTWILRLHISNAFVRVVTSR